MRGARECAVVVLYTAEPSSAPLPAPPTHSFSSVSRAHTTLHHYTTSVLTALSFTRVYTRIHTTLVQAERLFNLPLTRYGQLAEVKEEIERVAPLYDLYSEQVSFAESKSSMLWADLDMGSIQKGADELHKRCVLVDGCG